MNKDKLVIFVLVVGILIIAFVGKQKGWWSGSIGGSGDGNQVLQAGGGNNSNNNGTTTAPPSHQESTEPSFVTSNGSTVTKEGSEWVQPGGNWFSDSDRTTPAYGGMAGGGWSYQAPVYTDRPNPYAGSSWFSPDDKTNAAYTNVKNATFRPSWEYTDRALPAPYTGQPAGETTPAYGQVGGATFPPGWKYTERPVN